LINYAKYAGAAWLALSIALAAKMRLQYGLKAPDHRQWWQHALTWVIALQACKAASFVCLCRAYYPKYGPAIIPGMALIYAAVGCFLAYL
jgi:hypothetical protein